MLLLTCLILPRFTTIYWLFELLLSAAATYESLFYSPSFLLVAFLQNIPPTISTTKPIKITKNMTTAIVMDEDEELVEASSYLESY
jgi:hypothetical protein